MGSVYYGLGEWERELSLPPLMFLGMEVVVWWYVKRNFRPDKFSLVHVLDRCLVALLWQPPGPHHRHH